LQSDPEQPVLFEDVGRLSGEMWLALATCEAISRSGGRMTAADMSRVIDEWREQGRLPMSEVGLGALAIQVAPLAFVLHPDDERDVESLRTLVAMTRDDDIAYATAQAMLVAMRECLQRNRAPDLAVFAARHAIPSELSRAIARAGEHVDDLEAAMTDFAPPDDTRQVACLTGLLLGAAGCEIPRRLALATPERAAIDAIVEPFAQLLAATAG
jgi:ADP-ribosylglycohydrolase